MLVLETPRCNTSSVGEYALGRPISPSVSDWRLGGFACCACRSNWQSITIIDELPGLASQRYDTFIDAGPGVAGARAFYDWRKIPKNTSPDTRAPWTTQVLVPNTCVPHYQWTLRP